MYFEFFLLFLALFLFFGFLVALTLALVGKARTRVPFLAAPFPVIDEAINLFRFGEGDRLYDLGSGNGRMIFRAVDRIPGLRAFGIEKSPLPYLSAVLLRRRRERVELQYGSFEEVSLHAATHIFLYLLPEVITNLEEKFRRELRRGVRVISCDFPLGWKSPLEIRNARYGFKIHTLYLYEF